MSVNKVQLANGETIIDISDSTVTPETLAEGVIAYNAAGERIVGTMKQGSQVTVTDDENGNVMVDGIAVTDDGNGNITMQATTTETDGNVTIGG